MGTRSDEFAFTDQGRLGQETDEGARVRDRCAGRGETKRPLQRRWLRIPIYTAIVLVVLVFGGTAGFGWYITSKQIVPKHPQSPATDLVLGVSEVHGKRTVTLTASQGTRKPGVRGLAWEGGAAMMGDVVSQSPGRVERALLRGPAPLTGTKVSVSWNYPSDPRLVLDAEVSEVSVSTELGPAPAWYVPATGPHSSTWVISVHGQNGRPNSTMKTVPTAHRLGLPVLSVSYRNDIAAPASPDGLLHLGESEWRDVDAAIRTARSMGAQRVVLDGSSMGGAIVGQTLVHSPQANLVSAVIMDAPGVDWSRVANFQGRKMHAPAAFSSAVQRMLEWRIGADLDKTTLINHPPRVKPPMLLFHGSDDPEIPVGSSRDLAAAGHRLNWPIQYEEFPHAGHTQSWNVDRPRYEKLLADFLTRTVLR